MSWPFSSHQPWPPAVVFLIEARCGPDALGGSWGEAGTVGGQHSRPLLPPHCIQSQSQTQAPSQRPVELPTLFPALLAKPSRGASSSDPSAWLYSAATWKPLASSHTSSTSASLTDHLCGVLGRRRRGGKRGWGWGRRQAGRRPLQRGKKKENTQKVGPG